MPTYDTWSPFKWNKAALPDNDKIEKSNTFMNSDQFKIIKYFYVKFTSFAVGYFSLWLVAGIKLKDNDGKYIFSQLYQFSDYFAYAFILVFVINLKFSLSQNNKFLAQVFELLLETVWIANFAVQFLSVIFILYGY